MKRLRAAGLAVMLVITGALVSVSLASPAQAAPVICEKFGSTSIQNGAYIVQNNVWGADTAQCIDVNQSGGFNVTQADHNKATNGAPAAYPSIYAGCHYTNCTSGPMPIQLSQVGSAPSSIGVSYPGGGTWNAAYDIWADPQPLTDGQNGLEIMIWLNRQGGVQPIGSDTGANVTIAGQSFDVWYGNAGWHVMSFLSTSPLTSFSFDARDFIDEVINRVDDVNNSWYLTSIQAGFEPWIGGAGLAVNSFSAQVNSGPPPPTTTSPPPPTTTSPPPPVGGGDCTATASTESQWQQGYVTQVTVSNTSSSTMGGWSVGFDLPGGHSIVNSWNANLSGGTATNLAYNGNLGPGQSTSFGFQASRSGGDQLPSGFSCSAG